MRRRTHAPSVVAGVSQTSAELGVTCFLNETETDRTHYYYAEPTVKRAAARSLSWQASKNNPWNNVYKNVYTVHAKGCVYQYDFHQKRKCVFVGSPLKFKARACKKSACCVMRKLEQSGAYCETTKWEHLSGDVLLKTFCCYCTRTFEKESIPNEELLFQVSGRCKLTTSETLKSFFDPF